MKQLNYDTFIFEVSDKVFIHEFYLDKIEEYKEIIKNQLSRAFSGAEVLVKKATKEDLKKFNWI